MPKPRRRLPKGIQRRKNGTLQIAYKNEFGKIERENTGQSDVKAAELMLAQARTDVAMKKRFATLTFEHVKFIDLFNDWWTNHGNRTRSKYKRSSLQRPLAPRTRAARQPLPSRT